MVSSASTHSDMYARLRGVATSVVKSRGSAASSRSSSRTGSPGRHKSRGSSPSRIDEEEEADQSRLLSISGDAGAFSKASPGLGTSYGVESWRVMESAGPGAAQDDPWAPREPPKPAIAPGWAFSQPGPDALPPASGGAGDLLRNPFTSQAGRSAASVASTTSSGSRRTGKSRRSRRLPSGRPRSIRSEGSVGESFAQAGDTEDDIRSIAAIAIQAAARGMIARNAVYRKRAVESAAALTIQLAFWEYQARKADRSSREVAAIAVQAAVRGFLARRQRARAQAAGAAPRGAQGIGAEADEGAPARPVDVEQADPEPSASGPAAPAPAPAPPSAPGARVKTRRELLEEEMAAAAAAEAAEAAAEAEDEAAPRRQPDPPAAAAADDVLWWQPPPADRLPDSGAAAGTHAHAEEEEPSAEEDEARIALGDAAEPLTWDDAQAAEDEEEEEGPHSPGAGDGAAERRAAEEAAAAVRIQAAVRGMLARRAFAERMLQEATMQSELAEAELNEVRRLRRSPGPRF